LIGNNYYPLYARPMVETADKMISSMPIYYQPDCDIYQLVAGNKPVLLKHFDSCPLNESTSAWNGTQAWIAKGFAGLEMLKW